MIIRVYLQRNITNIKYEKKQARLYIFFCFLYIFRTQQWSMSLSHWGILYCGHTNRAFCFFAWAKFASFFFNLSSSWTLCNLSQLYFLNLNRFQQVLKNHVTGYNRSIKSSLISLTSLFVNNMTCFLVSNVYPKKKISWLCNVTHCSLWAIYSIKRAVKI